MPRERVRKVSRSGSAVDVGEVAEDVEAVREEVVGVLRGRRWMTGGLPLGVSGSAARLAASHGAGEAVVGRVRGRPPSLETVVDLGGLSLAQLEAVAAVREGQLVGLEEARATLRSILQGVVQRGENQSVLVLGAPGSGKSVIVEQALCDLRGQGGELGGGGEEGGGEGAEGSGKKEFLVVHLDGGSVSDDNGAVAEIARQLALDPEAAEAEAEVRGRGAGRGRRGGGKKGVVGRKGMVVGGGWEAGLDFVVSSLKEGRLEGKAVVLVIDDFGAFAHRTRQLLLYSLLDLVHDKGVNFCIVGIDRRLDVVDSLEKRLRSRFSHRTITTPTPTLPTLTAVAFRALLTPLTHHSEPLQQQAISALLHPSSLETLSHAASMGVPFRWVTNWITHALSLPSSTTPPTTPPPTTTPPTTPPPPTSSPFLTSLSLSTSTHLLSFPSRWEASLLPDLPLTTLTLLVVVARLEVAQEKAYTFSQVHDRFLEWFKRRSGTALRPPPRPTLLRAFQHLTTLGLLRTTDSQPQHADLSLWRPTQLAIPPLHLLALLPTLHKKRPDLPPDLIQLAKDGL